MAQLVRLYSRDPKTLHKKGGGADAGDPFTAAPHGHSDFDPTRFCFRGSWPAVFCPHDRPDPWAEQSSRGRSVPCDKEVWWYYKVTVKAVSGKDWTFDGKSELEVYLTNSVISGEIALSDSTNKGFTGWKAITSTTGFTVTSNKSTDTTKVTFKLTATGLMDDSAVVEIDITNV